jgi:outer membrane protein OmpA-like peptidoglycan-associated protein
MKFRLFASVAAPVLSLPLMLQPVGAMPLRAAVEVNQAPGSVPDLIQVQQQVPVPEDGEKPQRPRREKSEAGQGEEKPQRRQSAEDGGGASERPQRREKAEDNGGAAERPARRAQAEQGETEQKKPAKRDAERQQDAPAAGERPRREAQGTDAKERQPAADRSNAEGERPKPSRDRADPSKADAADKAKPDTAKPAPAKPEKAQSDRAKPADPDQARPQRQSAGDEQSPERPRAQGDRNKADPKADPKVDPKAAERNARDTDAATPPRDAKDRNQRDQTRPDTAAQPDATRPDRNQADRNPADRDQNNRRRDDADQANPNQTGRDRPDRNQADRNQQDRDQAGNGRPRPPQIADTPDKVERAKELAKDPKSAQRGEQLTLPVENGAAVLDSAKEDSRPRRPDRDGERPRRDRDRDAAQQADRAPPRSDADSQSNTRETADQRRNFRELSEERGERLDRRPQFDRPRGWDYRGQDGQDVGRNDRDDRGRDRGRVIISIDNQSVVRHDDSRRFYDEDGRQPEYERLRDGRVREVIERDDGTRIVTVRNRYGEIVQRSRIVRGGEEYVLYYAPELSEQNRGADYTWRDPGDDLPPMRLDVPLDDYIIDTSSEPDRNYYEFLEQPPVEQVERVYSLDEVRYSARIRDKVRRIDLDTVTFATGSAEIPMNQASSLRKVADAINQVLKKDPAETFLIEGHTDAVGADDANLVLSDERAESVARVLTDAFNIPPENLATQGYGERYLKVRSEGPVQENRRVTIRRITALVKPVASK